MRDKDEPILDDWRKRAMDAAVQREIQPAAATARQGDRIHEREEEEPERWDGMS
jgi:hypothetical protein